MKVTQVSTFVENQPGRLVAMLEALRAENIDIRALSVADHADFGIVRMILSDSQRGAEALKEAGFTTRENTVLQKEMPDRPGGLLDAVARPLAQAGINLEYFYASLEPSPGKATVVLKVGDPDRAERVIGQ